MSHKVQVVLPDPVARQLQELAAAAGEPASTLAAHLVRHGVALAAKDGKVRPSRHAPLITGNGSAKRPRWLEHYNTRRRHSGIGDRPPISRVRNLSGQNS